MKIKTTTTNKKKNGKSNTPPSPNSITIRQSPSASQRQFAFPTASVEEDQRYSWGMNYKNELNPYNRLSIRTISQPTRTPRKKDKEEDTKETLSIVSFSPTIDTSDFSFEGRFAIGQKDAHLHNNVFLRNLFASMGQDGRLIPQIYHQHFLVVYNTIINFDAKQSDEEVYQSKQLFINSLNACCDFYKIYLKKDITPQQLVYEILKSSHSTYSQSDWQAWFLSIVFSLSAALINAYGNEASTLVLMSNSLAFNIPLNVAFSATQVGYNIQAIWKYISDEKTSWPAKISVSLLFSYIEIGSFCYALAAALLASKKIDYFPLKVFVATVCGISTATQRHVALSKRLLSVLNRQPNAQLWNIEPPNDSVTVNSVKQITAFIYPDDKLDVESARSNKWSYKIVSPANIGSKSRILHQGAACIDERDIRTALNIEDDGSVSEWENYQGLYITLPEIEQNLLEIPIIKVIIVEDNSLKNFLKDNFSIYTILHICAIVPLLLPYTTSMLGGLEFILGIQIWTQDKGDDQTPGPLNDTIFYIAAALTLPAVAYLPIVASGTFAAIKKAYRVFKKYLDFSQTLKTNSPPDSSINGDAKPLTINFSYPDLTAPLLIADSKVSRKEQAVAGAATGLLCLGSLGTTVGLATNGLELFQDKFSNTPGGVVFSWLGVAGIVLEVAGTNLKPFLNMLIKSCEGKIQLIKQSRMYCSFTNNLPSLRRDRVVEAGTKFSK